MSEYITIHIGKKNASKAMAFLKTIIKTVLKKQTYHRFPDTNMWRAGQRWYIHYRPKEFAFNIYCRPWKKPVEENKQCLRRMIVNVLNLYDFNQLT